jgi:ATP-dependent helicase/nuclease subunit B
MLQRIFLGWDQPFLDQAADWLLGNRDELPHSLVVAPTAQGGRRLQHALAAKAGALLLPKTTTPGALLKVDHPRVAPDWMERLAWLVVLESIDDWSAFEDLFPTPPEAGGDWADGLAAELVSLRRSLQENGLNLARAARMLAGSVEAGRWNALARLEKLADAELRSWGKTSRSRELAERFQLPVGFRRIILAGVAELPPLVERALAEWGGEVFALIAAPESEEAAFSASGMPLECWNGRVLPWPAEPAGAVVLAADPRQQAQEALAAVARRNHASDEVVLGCADPEAAVELVDAFTGAGWPAHHPGAPAVRTGLHRWLGGWAKWLADPRLGEVAGLLTLPETAAIIGDVRFRNATHLAELRNEWMLQRPDDLRRLLDRKDSLSSRKQEAVETTVRMIEVLEKWRAGFLRGDLVETMNRLLDTLGRHGPETLDEALPFRIWMEQAAPLIARLDREPVYWIQLMLGEVPAAPAPVPADRVIDVQGWLELLLEPAPHLVVCGMNEGRVPPAPGGDPWLGEAARRRLGLPTTAQRSARDAFLYQAMIMARRDHGRVDLICAKNSRGGDSLLPSRLLLAAADEDLPGRVKFLFREVPPSDAGLVREIDWKWKPRRVAHNGKLAVTSLSTWLACPLRFYLKHGLRMQSPEPDRVEWHARDFGNVAHDILERWGRDPEARGFSKVEAIHDWMSAELDGIVRGRFGDEPPLSIRLQTESLRQRLQWLARVQAVSRAEGWEVLEVEHPFELRIGGTTISARIDRIDRHRETGRLRVLDYKTGRMDAVEKSHRTKITARTNLPAHLPAGCPAVFSSTDKGKPADFRWTNLQLPIYAEAIRSSYGEIPLPGYFMLGDTEAGVAIKEWSDFGEADLEAAVSCAEWIVKQIEAGVFWPPADKVTYDDFAVLTAGNLMEDCFVSLENPEPG